MVHIWQSASWCNDNFLSGLRLCDVGLVHGLLAWLELGWPVGFRSRYSPLVLAVCIHSLFSPLIGLFWLSSVSGLHLDHLYVIVAVLPGWDCLYMLASECVGSHFQLIRGVQVFNMTVGCLQIWLKLRAVFFFFRLFQFSFWHWVFGKQNGYSSLIISAWNWVMGKRNLGSKQTSKELLESDLSRISTVLMFGLVCL